MSPSYPVPLLLFLLLACLLPPTAARGISWASNLTLLGSATLLPGEASVALTTNSSDGIGAGRALYSVPVCLLLPPLDPRAAPAHASFHTRFTFRIVPSPSYGDGLAFILTSSRTFLGGSNGYLGMYPSAATGEHADVSTVAVELDTHRDVALRDPDGDHVALDAGSIFSLASASPGVVDLRGSIPVTAWVEYKSTPGRLRAWLSNSTSHRTRNPQLSVDIDLAPLLRAEMYVGFAASNGEGTALHIVDVDTWTFVPPPQAQRSRGVQH
jgi:hypothetical protein